MKFIFFSLLFCSALQLAQAQTAYPATAVPDRIVLTFAGDPAHTQAVTWRTDTLTGKGIAMLKPASPHPGREDSAVMVEATQERIALTGAEAIHHTARFIHLQPATQYMYRVGDGVRWSEWLHFTTAADQFRPFSFIYMGDAQNDHKELWSRAMRAAYAQAPQAAFSLHAGDLINRTNTDHEWGEWFYAGGWIYGMMPVIATPGNHEYYRDEQRRLTLTKHWRPQFAFPENGPAGLEEVAYYLDYQDVRIISICSQAFLLNKADSASQVAWVEELLRNNPCRWTIITMHHPLYSSAGGRDNRSLRDAFQPMFNKYGVDLVLTGHDHTYGRGVSEQSPQSAQMPLSGPVYITSVSGPKMYVPALEQWQQRAAANTQLYQVIDINADNIQYKCYTVTGQLYDAFRIDKKSAGQKTLTDQQPREVKEMVELPPAYRQKLSATEKQSFEQKKDDYLKRKP
ncbi:purple acid phosphatase family protein [Chitinophaga cymbidii]|uniref:Phosphoesterase n=1 Tax=Chitinophaga cymbidii TaxID=1096750 RepID=A0A512RQ37_9BACT|nr:metallophosphoesterase family protein [Chitinophaga cymbidii]GEP97797.1 phosphoesterase [Chitinophaga cymbidii]